MSQTTHPRADGSSPQDAPPVVKIDRSDAADRYRYVCPNGHTTWSRTNSHIWCKACSEQSRQDEDVNPEHWSIHDKKTGERIPWSSVRLAEDDR